MDDYSGENYTNKITIDSSSFVISNKKANTQTDTYEHLNQLDRIKTPTKKKVEGVLVQVSRAAATNLIKKIGESNSCRIPSERNVSSTEPYCHVKLESIVRLKDSTRKLISLLEEINLKTPNKHPISQALSGKIFEADKPPTDVIDSVTDVCASALQRLETQTQILESIPVQDEDDDCSVFKKLTRKCNCLNQQEYNDFVIHFNEDTKHFTSTIGEVIKNLRILKKFLYMGGGYTKHALMFLNEGLGDSSYTEKVEIIQGCAHADMCNVFEDFSLVITCIAWPYKYDSYGDTVTQELAASFMHKLAQLEEGRRYLKFTSKITNDIKKVLRKKGSKLDFNTVEALHATIDALNPQNVSDNVTHNCRSGDEGFGAQTIKALINYRRYMTWDEILIHLDLLNKLSCEFKGRIELKNCLKTLVELFKDMLIEYNDSEINIIVTNILNNMVSGKMLEQEEPTLPTLMAVANTGTEPVQVKHKSVQIPLSKKNKNNVNKSKINMSTFRGKSRQNVVYMNSNMRNIKSKKFKEKNPVIFVPMEK